MLQLINQFRQFKKNSVKLNLRLFNQNSYKRILFDQYLIFSKSNVGLFALYFTDLLDTLLSSIITNHDKPQTYFKFKSVLSVQNLPFKIKKTKIFLINFQESQWNMVRKFQRILKTDILSFLSIHFSILSYFCYTFPVSLSNRKYWISDSTYWI